MRSHLVAIPIQLKKDDSQNMEMILAMRIFVTVAKVGSLVAAADHLGLSTTAVSRHIRALEKHLGARLLHRTTRRLSLSEPGQVFLERAQHVLEYIEDTETLISENILSPIGHLRVSAPQSFGTQVLAPLLPGFSRRYPQLALQIELSDRQVNLVHDRVDIALRISNDLHPQLVARKIAPIQMIACASPAYLEKHGVPTTPYDLVRHKTLHYTYMPNGDSWTFFDASGVETSVRISSNVCINSGELLREYSLAGAGIAVYPSFIIADDIAQGNLIPVLTNWSVGDYHLYAVYLSRKFLEAKIRVFIDCMLETVTAERND